MAEKHICRPPTIVGLTVPQQPDWTCGQCGRVWRDCRMSTGVQWWAEVRGPAALEEE